MYNLKMWKYICYLFVVLYWLTTDTCAWVCYSDFCHDGDENYDNRTEELFSDGLHCFLTPIQRDESCINLTFHSLGHFPPPGIALLDLKLSAYVISRGHKRFTAFNLTAKDIKFRRLLTRYQSLADSKLSHCRDIKLHGFEKLETAPDLFVSCPYANETFEADDYRLEYLIAGESYEYSRKLVFKVPRHSFIDENVSNIRDYHPFAYVDVSDISMLSIYIQPLPQHFNVTHYRIWMNDTKSIKVYDLISNERHHLQYDFPVAEGLYYFGVSAMHPNCSEYGCFNSSLPAISTKQPAKRLLIMIISFVWIPPVILYAGYYVYNLNRKKGMMKRLERKLNCLLVYSSTHLAHVNVMSNLAIYLRSCNINAMIDVLDIPKTTTKDPGLWCDDVFRNADIILIATSPPSNNTHVPVIYGNLDNHALRLIKENYSARNKRYVTIEFPYCKIDDVPEEARSFKRFQLPDNLDKLIKYIHEAEYIRFFGISSKEFLDSINVATREICRESLSNPINTETENLLPVRIHPVNSSIRKEDFGPINDHTTQYFITNIDELNLLGESSETDRERRDLPSDGKNFCINHLVL